MTELLFKIENTMKRLMENAHYINILAILLKDMMES